MALEMVDRKIRFVWNNGAGARAIVHNVSLEAAMGGDLMSQVRLTAVFLFLNLCSISSFTTQKYHSILFEGLNYKLAFLFFQQSITE